MRSIPAVNLLAIPNAWRLIFDATSPLPHLNDERRSQAALEHLESIIVYPSGVRPPSDRTTANEKSEEESQAGAVNGH